MAMVKPIVPSDIGLPKLAKDIQTYEFVHKVYHKPPLHAVFMKQLHDLQHQIRQLKQDIRVCNNPIKCHKLKEQLDDVHYQFDVAREQISYEELKKSLHKWPGKPISVCHLMNEVDDEGDESRHSSGAVIRAFFEDGSLYTVSRFHPSVQGLWAIANVKYGIFRGASIGSIRGTRDLEKFDIRELAICVTPKRERCYLDNIRKSTTPLTYSPEKLQSFEEYIQVNASKHHIPAKKRKMVKDDTVTLFIRELTKQKYPRNWIDASLKHKKQEKSILNLIKTFDKKAGGRKRKFKYFKGFSLKPPVYFRGFKLK